MLRRITPSHYNLYDENENHVGSIHRTGAEPEGWFGMSHDAQIITGTHPSKYHAGHDLMGRVDLMKNEEKA